MPVRRFRSVEEMSVDRWYAPGDPALFRAISEIWERGTRLLRPSFPPGVHKHRSVEDMNRLTEQWRRENFERFHARRREEPS